MSLEDRIKDEMYVDAESMLEDEFGRVAELYDLYEDNTVAIADNFDDVGPRERILIHLIAWQYIAEAHEDESSVLAYDYFYERFDKDDSTVRGYFGDLVDDGLVAKGEGQGEHELVVQRLSDAIDRIEADGDADN